MPQSFRIESHKELPSTNALALHRAREGELQGLVVVADFQSAGHGKYNRPWISPPGKNLLFSILLRPSIAVNKAPILTQVACRAVANVLKNAYAIPCTIRRPNDILVSGKKICGILVESYSSGKSNLTAAVIGIGLNVNSDIAELPSEATSIKEFTGSTASLNDLLLGILEEFKTEMTREFSLAEFSLS